MFILIESSAVARMIHARTLQSPEFSDGAGLAELLITREPQSLSLPNSVRALRTADGYYFVGAEPAVHRTIVFDLEAADPFRDATPAAALTTFQRTLRMAVKIWNGLPFSQPEYAVTDGGMTKYVVFPFPIGAATELRMTIDRVHRTMLVEEEHLLVYRWAREGGSPTEMPSRARLNVALHGVAGAVSAASASASSAERSLEAPLSVTSLRSGEVTGAGILIPFEHWIPLLTDVQRAFVQRPLVTPERLEGAAGTGKTLALMLKAVHTLRHAALNKQDHHVLFITHSVATKRAIEDKLQVIDSVDEFVAQSRSASAQSLTVATLHEWCGAQLGHGLGETEYLDRDAAESKALQRLYVEEALDEAITRDLGTHKRFMSEKFVRYLATEDRWAVAEMMQHEIAVMVKGRAQENLDLYRELPPVQYNLPLENGADRGFVFLVYQGYAARLKETAQFDTDDIVLSAMSQLDTPIWRRRREHEGFDSVFIDETHLFNMNELSIIHFIPRDVRTGRIAFAVDRSQAVGDRGVDSNAIEGQLVPTGAVAARTSMKSVFRSSPDIVNLALAVTSSGATLFTNFDDPLCGSASTFTAHEEELAVKPTYLLLPTDEEVIGRALEEAERMAGRHTGGRSAVALIIFDAVLMAEFKKVVREKNRPFEILERRGDMELVNRARATQRFILAAPEYVGGLEFDGVVLVGVDVGRVPPAVRQSEGRHFLRYAAHNLLYVAITRARFEVVILGNQARGLSDLLSLACEQQLLETVNLNR